MDEGQTDGPPERLRRYDLAPTTTNARRPRERNRVEESEDEEKDVLGKSKRKRRRSRRTHPEEGAVAAMMMMNAAFVTSRTYFHHLHRHLCEGERIASCALPPLCLFFSIPLVIRLFNPKADDVSRRHRVYPGSIVYPRIRSA